LLKTVTNKTKAVIPTNLLQRILLPFRSAVRINGIVVMKKQKGAGLCVSSSSSCPPFFKNAMEKKSQKNNG
jgi:hypothetical protein